MNRTMNKLAVLAVAGVMAGSATGFAADAAPQANPVQPAKVSAAKLQELTLTGIVTKRDITVAGKSRTTFELITASGAKLHLPIARAGKKAAAAPAIKLADYIGQNVKVVAMGSELKRGDKIVVRVRMLKSIEKIAAA